MSQIISADYDPSVSGLAGNVGDRVGVAGGASAWVKFGSGVTDWRPDPGDAGGGVSDGVSITGSGTVADPFSAVSILSRAQSLVPTAGFTKVLGPGDFDGSALFGEVTGTAGGTAAMSTTHKGGVVKVASGASASGIIQLSTPGTAVAGRGISSLIDNARTTPWYFYAEFYVATAIDANATLRIQMAAMAGGAPANPTFGIGANGSVSTTNFSYRLTDGAGAVAASGSGPLLDTNKHTAEIYNDGTTAKVLFDGVQIGTDIAASLIGTAPMTWVVAALNGATAVNREIDVDALYVVV